MRTTRSLPYKGESLSGGICPGGLCPGGLCPVRPPPVNRITDASKNVTLPQTSFAGGNNVHTDNQDKRHICRSNWKLFVFLQTWWVEEGIFIFTCPMPNTDIYWFRNPLPRYMEIT